MTSKLWLVISVLASAGCVEPEAELSSAAQDLSALDWSSDLKLDSDFSASFAVEPAVVSIGGSGAIMVYQAHSCAWSCSSHLKWASTSGGNWSDPEDVPGANTTSRPSLARFNGHVYLFYASGTDQYMARYDSGVGWTGSTLLPFSSLGAVAIAPYGSSLVIVRADPGSSPHGQLSWRTMDTAERFSAEQPIARSTTAASCGAPRPVLTPAAASIPTTVISLPVTTVPFIPLEYLYEYATSTPALAAHAGCLYLVNRDGASDKLVFNTFGGAWGSQRDVPNGTGGAPQTSTRQPAIASFAGILHMVRPSDGAAPANIKWSYLDSQGWSAATTVPNQNTTGTPALAPLANWLLMVHLASYANTDSSAAIWSSYYQ